MCPLDCLNEAHKISTPTQQVFSDIVNQNSRIERRVEFVADSMIFELIQIGKRSVSEGFELSLVLKPDFPGQSSTSWAMKHTDHLAHILSEPKCQPGCFSEAQKNPLQVQTAHHPDKQT